MKKLLVLVLIFILAGSMLVPRVKAQTDVYGMVFVYYKEPFQVYKLLLSIWFPDLLEVQNVKWAGLVNYGKIAEVHIRIPLSESFVYISYPNPNGYLCRIELQFHKVGSNYILFTFRGAL